MKNILVTGASSGIGKMLTEKLIKKGFRVWSIARRKNLLRDLKNELQSDNFFYTAADITDENFWKKLIKDLNNKKFLPDVIILNAAIRKNDLENGIDIKSLREMMEINFFSVLEGVKAISESFSGKLHFITISSTSAFKGSYVEGIGYAASKSALTIAFESLFQKHFNSKINFTTIFLGPVITDMMRFTKPTPFILSADKTAEYVIEAIESKKPFLYYPRIVFMILSIMRLLPNQFFFKIWTKLQKQYT